jgi:cytochrome c5
MVPRMQGKGNMGQLMAEMMRGPGGPAAGAARPLAAPTAQETREIVDYLQRHALRPAGPELAGALATPGGQMFERACSQCHVLPDPGRHRASEWPAVVRRMEANMAWMNRIVGSQPDPREPRLEPAEITAFLQRHATRGTRPN